MQARVVILGLLFLCFWPTTMLAQSQVLLNQFTLSSEGADVLLTWELPQEESVREYRLFRRVNDERTSAHVTTMNSDGSLRYTYLDDDIFKAESRTIHYELQIIAQSGQVYRYNRSLSHNPTSVQRTWGSIKAMFRY